ncbi:MAG: transcriptional regulator [Candidatus Woesebacteria bacterium GW2011_GWB1_39_10b]|uniref:Probable transcriptional regulatory protein UT19_C0018G0009 n=1 Tax=Candidatus Woesebacteria bacterium GW2011_GWB1_39_10b TaxID=1618573 RepID=A0A0G0P4U2_9BACT|nr:MAG: transcriptional regulator [Candidatus Woesebacteria bacterium GW2011_GWB1_39_10b]KKS89134.1 MAG: transcriptional regulator [Parcubacteria group bacterium GW2011_GWC1_43_11b]
MSGHSHYATIKRQKEAKDAAKGRVFSRLARGIQIAVKSGGGTDPDANYKLRMAIEAARSSNMPKENIERAIKAAQAKSGDLEEVIYEGYGPGGIAVIVEVVTDNRNRTGQEIKNIFDRGGGSLAGPGSVSFNFDPRGLILTEKKDNFEEVMLPLVDLGVEDISETDDAIEVYTEAGSVREIRDKLTSLGFKVNSIELISKPKNFQVIEEVDLAKKILSFLENLEAHDDVQKLFTNVEIPQVVLEKIGN